MPTITVLTADQTLQADVERALITMGADVRICADFADLTDESPDLVLWHHPSFDDDMLRRLIVLCPRVICLVTQEQRRVGRIGPLPAVIPPLWYIVVPFYPDEFAIIINAAIQHPATWLKQQWAQWQEAQEKYRETTASRTKTL